jgi:hypothetical protein
MKARVGRLRDPAHQMSNLDCSQAQQHRGSVCRGRGAAGIRLGNTARSKGIGRRVGCNSLQTATALALLQQRAVFRERLLQEDHALQRGLDARPPQLVDASLDRRVHSEHAN